MDDFHILRCGTCSKKMGLQEVHDGIGSSQYCLDCSRKRIRNPEIKIKDWKFGIGNFEVKIEYLWDERYL